MNEISKKIKRKKERKEKQEDCNYIFLVPVKCWDNVDKEEHHFPDLPYITPTAQFKKDPWLVH